MKKINLSIISFFLLFPAIAQICNTCTSTITGNTSAPQLVTSGQTLCIAAGATVSGDILVQGGNLCNQGTIASQHLHVTAGGIFENWATVDVDSLLVSQNSTYFHNRGIITCERIAFTGLSEGINYGTGTIHCNYMGDSMATFINYGNLHIGYDFSNGYGEIFQNVGFMQIGRDFYNGYGSSFQTFCVVSVARNWYNSAYISGTIGGTCGGFSISNDSYNSGTVSSVDICDLNTTNGQLDANTGTLALVTNCSCNNICQQLTSVEEQENNNAFTIYPNPANEKINVETKNIFTGIAQLQTVEGKIISEQKFHSGKFELPLTNLAKGFYLLTLYSESKEYIGAKRISLAD